MTVKEVAMRCHPIHGGEFSVKRDEMHLFFLLEAWRVWAIRIGGGFYFLTSRDRVSTYQWGTYAIEHHHCAIWDAAPGHDHPVGSAPEASRSCKFKVQINAWLLENFDPASRRVV